ncbi:MotE family protein [Fictibacillus sp. KU28468]|uniref:MotE family protein n=1 Tax=Fictibacillus sp. KU28468 TaxID=2991053 RepID=UPI00223E6A73|nr:hypothetical protein [Fictibacillus sp. KU28468]UZJ77164.1 hypothetical protein OKX00_13270 [Fictibacillus sp. KU28468]
MERKEKTNRFSWILLVIVVPAIFVIVILALILLFMGVNIGDKAKEIGSGIPVVSSLIDKGDSSVNPADQNAQSEAYWKKKVRDRDRMIKLLQRDVDKKETEAEGLKSDLAAAQKQSESGIAQSSSETQNSSNTGAGSSQQNPDKKKIAAWYNTMSPKNSADILSKMKSKDAVEILQMLDDEVTGSILAKMDPSKAAELTLMLKTK